MSSRLSPIVVALGLLIIGSCGDAGPPRHLVLVTVDTLRADRLGCYGSELGLTTTLDAFAARSVRFGAAFSPAPFTLPSVTGLMTGRYPETLGVTSNQRVVPAGTSTLAALLSARGWRTGAVVGNWVLRRESGIGAGFATFDDAFPQVEANRPIPERTAADTTTAALRLLDQLVVGGADPVFLWVHYQDPHGPYVPPSGYRERALPAEQRASDGARVLPVSPDNDGFGGIPRYQVVGDHREVAYYRAGYDGEVRWVDEEIGRLLGGVAKRLPTRETAIVFAADHGEGMGEDDYWFAHGDFLTDVLVRVPLVIHVPGQAPAVRTDVASLVDVVPTLLRLFSVSAVPGLPGRDLLAPGASTAPGFAYLAALEESAIPRYGIATAGVKYVVSLSDPDPVEVVTTLDGDRLPTADQGLAERLGAFRAHLTVPAATDAPAVSPEDRERLRALGYVTSDVAPPR